MALAIVQTSHGSQAAGTGVPGAVVLGSAPTVGNLVVVFLHTTIGADATINSPSWQRISTTLNADMNSGPAYILVRYVQNGDTVTLPVMATAGTGKWAYAAYEISGVAGNIDSDLQVVGATDYQGALSPLTFPSQTPQAAGTLVLASQSNVFDTASITVPAGWTADVNTGAQTNWGTLAAMHFANPTAGTPLSITANAYGAVDVQQLILQAAVPKFAYVEQEYTADFTTSGGAFNTDVLLQKAPKVGNLIVYFGLLYSGFTAPTVAAGWTKFTELSSGGSDYLVGLYRYAQNGDTATLTAAFTDAGNHSGWGYATYEIAGLSGVWLNDFQSVKTAKVTGASFTTTTDTTLQANTLALVAAGFFGVGSHATTPSMGTGWAFNGGAGSTYAIGSSKTFASLGASVAQTVTLPASATAIGWAQALFGAAPSAGGHGLLTVGVGK